MAKPPKMTMNVQLVLAMFLAEPGADRFGAEITQQTGIGSGGLYPVLARLETAGWLIGHWEDSIHAARHGRPPRRYYRLTGEGESAARTRIPDIRRQKLLDTLLDVTTPRTAEG